MIKFFRHIRQKLIERNHVGKYMMYAVGEVLLVVIGILIALSINNWNDQRKINIQEQVLLKRLDKEFKANKNQLANKIDIRNSIIQNCTKLLKDYNKPENADLEQTIIHLSSILPTTYDPIQNDLVSSGTVEIIRNEALKQMLVSWSTDVKQLQEVEQLFFSFYEKSIVPYNIEIGIQRDISYYFWEQGTASLLEYQELENPTPGKSKISQLSKEKVFNDPKLEGIIAATLNFNQFNNVEAQTLVKRINEILDLLKEEIKK